VTTALPTLLAVGRSRLLFDSIEHLADKGFPFGAIVTAPGTAEYDVGPEDFEKLAERLGCDFLLTTKADSAEVREVALRRGVRAGISVNWQYVLPPSFLDLFPLALLNLHLGNLPDYKGNATVNWAILNGENQIHANIHRMVAELDAGDVLARERIAIDDGTYVADVLAEATRVAPELFEQALERLQADPDACLARAQVEGLRCYPRLPEDGLIEWTRPAVDVVRLVRASSRPYPGAFSYLGSRRITVWRARVATETRFLAVPGHVLGRDPDGTRLRVACGAGAVDLEEVCGDGTPVEPTALTRSIRARFSDVPREDSP
jgi:methionyl-tRNA formyltransferase